MKHQYKFTTKNKDGKFVFYCENCYKEKYGCNWDNEECENGVKMPQNEAKDGK